MKKIVIGLVALVLPAGSAFAEGSWTGFYAGLSAAGGEFSDGGGDASTDGFGIQAGYLRDLGAYVVGGELAYSAGNYGSPFSAADWDTTRLKAIIGYDAGKFLPYGLLGVSQYNVNQNTPFSDSVMIFGAGARYDINGKFVVGLEYVVENKDDFDNNFDMSNADWSLRFDYRF